MVNRIVALLGLSKRDLRVWLAGMVAGLLILIVAKAAFCYPSITHVIEDQAGVLTPADDDIATRIRAHMDRTHVQIAVLIVPSTNGEPIEDFANGTANQWGGGAAGRDDGVLVVLAIRDHRSRIEVGTGLEDRLPDSEATRILDAARPALRASHYGDAVRGIVEAVITHTAPGTPGAPRVSPDTGSDVPWAIILLALAGVGVLVFFLRDSSGSSRRKRMSVRNDPPPAPPRPYHPLPTYTPRPRTPTPLPVNAAGGISSAAYDADVFPLSDVPITRRAEPESVYKAPKKHETRKRASTPPSRKSSYSDDSSSSSSSSSSIFDSSDSGSSGGGGDWGGGGGDFGGGGGSSDW